MALRIKNWARFQHYGTRRTPPWIKVGRPLTIDNPEWMQLPDAAKAVLLEIWLLASCEHLASTTLAWRLHRDPAELEKILQLLVAKGFVERYQDASTMLAECEQTPDPSFFNEQPSVTSPLTSPGSSSALQASLPPPPEKEKTPMGSKKKERVLPRRPLPEDWEPTAKHIALAEELGLDRSRRRQELEKFKSHHAGKGSIMASWDAAFTYWLNNLATYQPTRPPPPISKEREYAKYAADRESGARRGPSEPQPLLALL